MKQWKCTVCGYIHEGEEPPETCPVCGADASKFEEVVEEAPQEVMEAEIVEEKTETEPAEPETSRRWRCIVCGYIHVGPEPPEKCPKCGADRSKFVEVTGEDEAAAPKDTYKVKEAPSKPAAAQEAPRTTEPLDFVAKYDPFLSLLTKHHAHPITVHLPNGVVPLSVAFMFLAMFFKSEGLGMAYFCNIIAVLLSMPLVLFTGYVDWKRVYGGNMTSLFLSKMVCGGIVTGASFILVLWRMFNPDVLSAAYSGRWFFVVLNLIMLGAAGFAGFQGGKLVFKE